VRIDLCGVRGSTPAPGHAFADVGGHTSCLAISAGSERPRLVVDAGTGIRQVCALLGNAPFDGTVLLTHLHWDHVHGLPFFSSADRDDASTRLLLPDQGTDAGEMLARAMSPPHFPIGPDGLLGKWTIDGIEEGAIELEGFSVLAREIPHKGGRTYGYRIASNGSDGNARSVAFLPDHSPTVCGEGRDGLGEVHEAALDLATGADVIIHGGQFTSDERAIAATYGHATIEYACQLAERAGTGQLLLVHHSPARTDEQVDGLRKRYGTSVSFGTEGTTLNL
jgi:ribonuclease BN (tRNA processing enzyme)